MNLKINHRSGDDWPQEYQPSYNIGLSAWIIRRKGQPVVGWQTQDENEALAYAQRLNNKEIS